ncbi:hypothetical protein [Actinoplanes sp. NBRC 101535]|uniref:hypothetical protein n=1 Tax=Actinoplanes sp. NBRC 101535 TaxID=3032196 RepID=UPI0024A2C4E7|nr:hypothetical protein [Actinoplanes sp. NBRC 101535]GLY06727.1 hypothetical protein Acsp01_71060 [Actinoplanes sp. NBRC 101535]
MRRNYGLLLAAIVLTGLTACGSAQEESKAAEVATLQSATPAVSAEKEAKADAERPRERLDTTPEEYEAMLKPYNDCMAEQGAYAKSSGGGGDRVARPATREESEKADAANRICEPKYMPLPPWERDPANPEAADFSRAVVKCLKGKGVEFVEVSDDGISIALGGDQNDAASIRDGMDLIPECERKVAAAKK